MNKTTLIIILGFALWIIIYSVYQSGLSKGKKIGYKHGTDDSANRLIDFSHWMSAYPLVFNTLQIWGNNLKHNATFGTWGLRDQLLKLGDTRICDLSPEARREYIINHNLAEPGTGDSESN